MKKASLIPSSHYKNRSKVWVIFMIVLPFDDMLCERRLTQCVSLRDVSLERLHQHNDSISFTMNSHYRPLPHE
jgi:hypothetical protein